MIIDKEDSSSVEEVRRLEEAGHWLLRLREDALSEETMAQWLEWCEADAANMAAFEKAQSLWRSIPPGLGAAFPRTKPAPARWRVAALAASLAALAGALFVLMQREGGLMGPNRMTRIEAPERVNENSVLPDGSHVALGARSAVALDFTREQRRLEMQNGTAFFRVKPDKARPFVVNAGPVSVTAVGTAFNIRRNDERVVVTVNEGIVKIDREGEEGSQQATAGYRLTYDTRSREEQLEPVDPAAELAWREGRLVYNGEPLDVVIENVNRYATKKITLADPALGRLKFTGTVFVDSIDTWLGALPRAFPVTVSQDATQTTLAPRQ